MGTILGIIGLIFVFALSIAINKGHREATGVDMPSRGAMARIRRAARKKGISQQLAYEQWLARKQKLAAKSFYKGSQQIKHSVRTLPLGNSQSIEAHSSNPKEVRKPSSVARIRAPTHEPFDFEHLSMVAATYGWQLRKQAGGLYYILDQKQNAIENPYAAELAIKTDFDHRDVEDFLLTC